MLDESKFPEHLPIVIEEYFIHFPSARQPEETAEAREKDFLSK